MVTDTVIAKDIEAVGDKAKYDEAVKKLLSNKIILAWILKGSVAEYQGLAITDIAQSFIIGNPIVSKAAVMPDEEDEAPKIAGAGVEDVSLKEERVTFDIRFEALVPENDEPITMIINVEAQNDFYPGYPLIKRAIYYCSRMISSQYGTVFTKSHYEKIKKVCSIWICTNPPTYRKNTISKYSLTEECFVGDFKEVIENYDLLTAIMICLGDYMDCENDLLKLLGVLLSNDVEINDKKQIMETDFNIPMTEELERQVSEMCNLSQGVVEKTELRMIIRALEKCSESEVKEILGVTDSEIQKAKDLKLSLATV